MKTGYDFSLSTKLGSVWVASAFTLAFLLFTRGDWASPIAIGAGVGAGWVIGFRVAKHKMRVNTSRLFIVGSMQLVQGVALASVLLGLFTSMGWGSFVDVYAGIPFVIIVVDFALRSLFLILSGMAAVMWQLSKH
tara:strand:+ start:415 stop:819 length:405 start_codon:yes stop_codon:yes gene_type:complete